MPGARRSPPSRSGSAPSAPTRISASGPTLGRAIERTHIVVAEPMPDDRELAAAFAGELDKPFQQALFSRMIEEMRLAGELGTLLQVELSLADDIRRARRQFLAEQERPSLFPDLRPKNEQGKLDLSGVTDETVFQDTEETILAALRRFAESAGGADARRRLFAGDAAQGVALIDLVRTRFDVVLMNPPFGAASLAAKKEFEKAYPRTKNDIYAAFVERGIQLLHPGGMLGAITSRTGFFLSSFQKWREEILLKEAPPVVFADLGYGVMDAAMVEAAAYCLEKRAAVRDEDASSSGRLRAATRRLRSLRLRPASPSRRAAARVRRGSGSVRDGPALAVRLLGQRRRCVQLFRELDRALRSHGRTREQGLQHARRLSLRAPRLGSPSHRRTRPLVAVRQGRHATSPFYVGRRICGEWGRDDQRAREHLGRDQGRQLRVVDQNTEFYFRPGLTWPLRTQTGSAPRAFLRGASSSRQGSGILPRRPAARALCSRLVSTQLPFDALVAPVRARALAAVQYEVGVIQRTPVPDLTPADEAALAVARPPRLVAQAQPRHPDRDEPRLRPAGAAPDEGRTLAARSAAWTEHVAGGRRRARRDPGRDRRALLHPVRHRRGGPPRHHRGLRREQPRRRGRRGRHGRRRRGRGRGGGRGRHRDPRRRARRPGPSASRSAASTSASPPVPASCRPSPSRSIRCRSARPRCSPATTACRSPVRPPATRFSFPADGILVDDPGHPRDLTAAVRAVFDTVFGASADAVWQEAAALLDPKGHDLRTWLAKEFFGHHLARHSKSRRKAPILWQLGPASAPIQHLVLRPPADPRQPVRPQQGRRRAQARARGAPPDEPRPGGGSQPDRQAAGRARRPGRRRRRAPRLRRRGPPGRPALEPRPRRRDRARRGPPLAPRPAQALGQGAQEPLGRPRRRQVRLGAPRDAPLARAGRAQVRHRPQPRHRPRARGRLLGRGCRRQVDQARQAHPAGRGARRRAHRPAVKAALADLLAAPAPAAGGRGRGRKGE